jgi:hypothetical protein
MGGSCCIDYRCRHICLHACNSLIGSKFAHFSANVNSLNFDINLYISFLGIVRHFVLEKFVSLKPVIAILCVNNFDIFNTVCNGFEFDVNNYFNYLSDLLNGCVYHEFCDFDSLYFVRDCYNFTYFICIPRCYTFPYGFCKKLFKLCLLFVFT